MVIIMKKIRIIPLIITIVLMLLIFFFSSQTSEQSSDLSKGVTADVVALFKRVFSVRTMNETAAVKLLHHYIRKAAHFTLYAVLGFLSAVTMRVTFRRPIKASAIYACAVCVLYSIADELHQRFVSGRSGQISDVFLDTAGSVAGILLLILVLRIRKGDRLGND